MNIQLVTFCLIYLLNLNGCGNIPAQSNDNEVKHNIDTLAQIKPPVVTGASRINEYYHLLENKKIALVVNHTSVINSIHLVDTLKQLGVQIVKIFAPEHGFRGNEDAGKHIENAVDQKTGIPLISLYGANKEPSSSDLKDIDLIVYDIQDVGVRFYTYISTMFYVMRSCAKMNIPILILDRPNPLGNFVDGPVMETAYQSFVGILPIPIVYGMTAGELAQMINGEHWLGENQVCDLTVIQCLHYDHSTYYELPIKPSPNLPNMRAIMLYPSLCLFEATPLSLGRGTDKQFQVWGHPDLKSGDYYFTPVPKPGAMHPPLEGKKCRGFDLTHLDPLTIFSNRHIDLNYIINAYKWYPDPDHFFNADGWIYKLWGNKQLPEQIKKGIPEDAIRATWQPKLDHFKTKREKYLLYQ